MPVTDQDVDKKAKNRKNDLVFAGIMLSIYAICCVIFVSGSFLWIREDRRTTQANATATAAVIITQQANATATAIARSTEQAQYEFIDPFNDNSGRWLATQIDDEFMTGLVSIEDGIYKWQVNDAKRTFVYKADFNKGNAFKDFDVYVDTKIVDALPGEVCSGFVFRNPFMNWDNGGYTFSVCNDSSLEVYNFGQGEWKTISVGRYSSAIRNNDWNRLEIKVRGNHFTFIINNEVAFETTDDRFQAGGLALFINVRELKPVSIWFDNFGFQSR